jgi:hypothetical protein
MRTLLILISFVLCGYVVASAQCSNSGNGNAWGQGGNTQAQAQAQPAPAIPTWLAFRVCQAAQPLLYSTTSMNAVQLFQAYRLGTASIVYLGQDPADPNRGIYRYTAPGGTDVTVVIEVL